MPRRPDRAGLFAPHEAPLQRGPLPFRRRFGLRSAPADSSSMNIVKIFGKEYRLRGEEDPEHLAAVAAYLDRVLREIHKTLPDTQDAAMLAALNLASELVALRGAVVEPDRVQSLIDLVDSV
jgi:hypothetical protein